MESLKNIRKILVPIDYSDYSIMACRYALKIARRAKADIILLHAFYSPAYDLIELTGNQSTQARLKDEVTEKLLISETKKLNSFITSFMENDNSSGKESIQISSMLLPGIAKNVIQKVSAEQQPSLVVMGTRGQDKKQNSILGSTTEIIIRKLKYPVLAIPEEYIFIGEENLSKVAFITEYDESDFVSIKNLMDFAALMGIGIHCLHIGAGKTDSWELLKMKGLKEYFRSNYKQVPLECEIISPKMGLLHSLDRYIEEQKVDLLAITTKKRNVLESLFKPNLTKKLLYHTRTPFLVFHS